MADRSGRAAFGLYPDCPICGSTGYIDITTASQVDPVLRICDRCGLSSRPAPTFHPWRGKPVWMVAPGWIPECAGFLDEGGSVTEGAPPTVTIWCGPPADLPYPPTPEDILAAAGIDPARVFA